MFAVNHHAPAYARSRIFSLLKAVTLQITWHDPRAAAYTAIDAVATAGTVRSDRVRSYLHDLYAATRPHARLGEVADLRHHINQVLDYAP